MVLLDELRVELVGYRPQLKELGDVLQVARAQSELDDLRIQVTYDGFWDDAEKSQKVMQKIRKLENTVDKFRHLNQKLEDTIALIDLCMEEDDDSSNEEILQDVESFKEELEAEKLSTLLTGEYDGSNAILTFHAGAGGTEAQDWAQMLYRMITRWAERHNYKYKLVDWLDGEEAGLKSATIIVEGLNAYGYLKAENGVHRLVRVSPFDSAGRRHTSFASIEVMPEFDNIDKVEIRDEDIEVTAHRSSGAGGQHINKTDSAIRILHKPTGIVVGCQTERSQLQNKETAMKMLKAKLMEIKLRERLDTIEDIQGNKTNIEWGAQICSYVFMPYTLAKDTRTGYEDGNITAVMDGEIDGFINAYLKMNAK